MYLRIAREELESAGHLNIFEITPEGKLTIAWDPSFLCGTRPLVGEDVVKILETELGKDETSHLIEKFADSLGRAAFMKHVS